jgi:hypothetical protein
MEFMSSPDTPKSQILICPFFETRIFEGLISGEKKNDYDGFLPVTLAERLPYLDG